MPERLTIYLTSGQMVEIDVEHWKFKKGLEGDLTGAEWTPMPDGMRMPYLSLDHVAAITSLPIDTKDEL
jgi:hypothetical protein